MLTALIIYVLIGLGVAAYEYKQQEAYIEEVKNTYPTWTRYLAVFIASCLISVIWPYIVYEIIRDNC